MKTYPEKKIIYYKLYRYLPKIMSKHSNSHLLFQMAESAGSPTGGGGMGSFFGRKSRKGSGTASSELNSPSFDYYEYFSNYGRLMSSTPPESPAPLVPLRYPTDFLYDEDRRAYLGDRGGSDRGRYATWGRSGPKYELIKGTDSPERTAANIYSTNSQHRQQQPYHSSSHQHASDHLSSRDHSHHYQHHSHHPHQSYHDMDASDHHRAYYHHQMTMHSPQSPQSPMAPMVSPPTDIVPATDTLLHRVTFIETNTYVPLDLPSPTHTRTIVGPQPTHIHHEWMVSNVQHLKHQFHHPNHQVLMNVETKSKFPFILYSTSRGDLDSGGDDLSPELQCTDGIYQIVSAITRPGSGYNDDDVTTPAGYIVSAFATFPGEDSDKLENNWITWTG